MNCNKCGYLNKSGSKFCLKCGNTLESLHINSNSQKNNINNNTMTNNEGFNQSINVKQTTPNFLQPVNQVNTQPINTLGNDIVDDQSFNTKTPKKINLGLIIGILILIFAGVGIFAFLGKNSEKNNNLEAGTNKETGSLKAEAKYESRKLTLFDDEDYAEINGKIKDISRDFRYAITKDNHLYEIGLDVEKKIDLPKRVKSIVNYALDPLRSIDAVFENEDGSITYYDQTYSELTGGTKIDKIRYTVDLKNVVFAFSTSVVTLEDGYLYRYVVENNQIIAKNKITLYKESERIGFSEPPTYSQNEKLTLDYLPDHQSFFLKMANGEIRQFDRYFENTSELTSSSNATIAPSKSEREYLENKKPVRILYYDVSYGEIYASEEKNTSIYYFSQSIFETSDRADCIKEKGSEALCNESIKKELALPNGYTINNIKELRTTSSNVKYSFEPMIIMDDMKVFYYEDNEWTELEELSQLYKNNHIVELITNQSFAATVTVLCDDGYLYEYKGV